MSWSRGRLTSFVAGPVVTLAAIVGPLHDLQFELLIAHLLPNAELCIYNSRPESAATLAAAAASMGIAPVRVTASPQLAVADADVVITVASFVLGASFVIFAYNIAISWVRGPIAEANPWRAHSLEWQVSSPPPIFNFDEIPQVVAGPYEYGVQGAQHAIMRTRTEEHEEVHA